MQNSVIVFDKNSNSREIIKSYLESFDFVDDIKLFDDYIDGYEEWWFDTESHLSFEEVLSAESIYELMVIEKEN